MGKKFGGGGGGGGGRVLMILQSPTLRVRSDSKPWV